MEGVFLVLLSELKDADLSLSEAKEVLACAGELDVKATSARPSTQRTLILLPTVILTRWQSLPGKVAVHANRVSDNDRSTLLSFLSGGDHQGCALQSDKTIDTLKQLKDEMSTDLTDGSACGVCCSTRRRFPD